GRRIALVDATPGVTRDRREGKGVIAGFAFTVIDTAGFDEGSAASLESRTQAQTTVAVAGANVALLLYDAREGVTPLDETVARDLRRRRTPVILVANKCESRASETGLIEGYTLGLGDPVAISAEHGEGLGDLLDALRAVEPDVGWAGAEPAPKAPLRLAVVGRPNAGKSTLVNRLIGEERLITGPEPGLTRDSIAVRWTYRGETIELVDTAGLRRKARVQAKLEKLSIADTFRSLGLAEVAVLVVDAEQPFEKQDLHIAARVAEAGRALVIALNKWDVAQDKKSILRHATERLEKSLPQLRGVKVVPLSALTGKGLEKIMPAVLDAYRRWNTRVGTGELNRWLEEVTRRHPPPAVRGRRIRLRFATQVKARPPTFVIFSSRPEAVPEHYVRYLANELRSRFGLEGVPLRLYLRRGENPFAPKRA
ncbi:MAG TPA: ribosome biogenesis GTPase Der, partial [Alphaproteobacteria bacterium]|nr:ribosome biogenesis GTPase Der [Alphaproteobacteria bacterium]